MPKIPTFDSDGKPNGWVLPVWSELSEPGLRPAQVYVTAIAPGTRKGPHLHMERRGVFFCLSGRVLVRKSYEGQILDKIIEPGGEYCYVPSGTPAALYNIGHGEALVLNMPNPSWSKDNPDDHPVEVWTDPPNWPPVLNNGVFSTCSDEWLKAGIERETRWLSDPDRNHDTCRALIADFQAELDRRANAKA